MHLKGSRSLSKLTESFSLAVQFSSKADLQKLSSKFIWKQKLCSWLIVKTKCSSEFHKWISVTFVFKPAFFRRIAFFVVAILAVAVQGNILTDGLESLSYMAFKKLLMAAGKSESYADCCVSLLKVTGAGDDVFHSGNLSADQIAEKLKEKLNIADFICSNGGYPFLFLLIAGLLFVVTCGCCCCFKPCRSEKQPVIVQMTRPAMYLDHEKRYERMDKV